MPIVYQPGMYFFEEPTIGTGESAKKKTPYIWIAGTVTHQQTPDGPVQTQTRQDRTIFCYISEAAFDMSAERLDAVGFNGDFVKPALTGAAAKGIWVECTHETYNDERRERWLLPGGGMTHVEPPADALRAAASRWQNYQRNKAVPPQPAPAAPAAQQAQAPPTGDEIPF